MTDTTEATRPIPRWLHISAILTVAATLVLLTIGQMVTSFGAGMADRVWPTEPWYLFSNPKYEFSYLIEHSHRIAGFTVGGLVSLLVLGLMWTEPRPTARWLGVAGIVLLLVGFGEFHRGLMKQRDVPTPDVRLPVAAVGVTLLGLIVALAVAVAGVVGKVRGGGLRLVGVAALIGVMIQGLFGGFRVMLNALVGTDLAAIHGVFAQVVFGLLVTLAVLTARPPIARLSEPQGELLRRWSVILVILLFVQVAWGAMVRHDPTKLTQRLHLLTAFLAVGVGVWFLLKVIATPSAQARVGRLARLLAVLFALQIVLGVEAWMVRFAQYTLPELVPITPMGAATRTAHALVGTALLAAAVALAVRLGQSAKATQTNASDDPDRIASRAMARTADAVGSMVRGDTK